MLGCYGGQEFETPNIDRLAARSKKFNRHFTGSLPCMPADMTFYAAHSTFSGNLGDRLSFGRPITYSLRRKGIPTQLITDHPHLFEVGGENYHTISLLGTMCAATRVTPGRRDRISAGRCSIASAKAKYANAANPDGFGYDFSRTYFREEADYPGPKTMRAAAEWLKTQGSEHSSFLCSLTNSTLTNRSTPPSLGPVDTASGKVSD